MFSASVSNANLIIYSSSSVIGVNTNYLFVFDNNIYKKISNYSYLGNQINLTLAESASINGNIQLQLYTGGITTSLGPALTTTFPATNTTVYIDITTPSLIEIIEQGNYNYTSYVYSNYVTGFSEEENFSSSSLIIKRNPPQGQVTINEGTLGPMNVHRFAALSSPSFGLATNATINTLSHFAFDYNSYGDQVVNSISFYIGILSGNNYPGISTGYITINEDYFNSPSTIEVGISTTVNFYLAGSPQSVSFSMIGTVLLNQSKYWIIFSPTSSSNFGLGDAIQIYTTSSPNYYTTQTLDSLDGISFSQVSSNGIAFTVNTERGIVLPSSDSIYNQLGQSQNITVQYGDESNLNVYTQIAIPNTSHYIQKNLLDINSQVYGVDVLATSNGENQYQVNGIFSNLTESYFTMISNTLTSNIINYTFYSPQSLIGFQLNSLGDYYTQSPQGTVLVSSSDFLGINKIELSTSQNFPINNTLAIFPTGSPQEYISNINYDYGNLGALFTALSYQTGLPIKSIYAQTIANVLNYLLICDTAIFLFNTLTSNIATIYTLTSSTITSSCIGTLGILFVDTLGNVYNCTNGYVNTIGSVSNIPTSTATYLTNTYIGVSTISDINPIQLRKRIYQLTNGILTHQTWSTNIPEPEITFITATQFGALIIGSYNESVTPYGNLYAYYNSNLFKLSGFPTSLRADYGYYSISSGNLYVGYSGSTIYVSTILGASIGTFLDVGLSFSGNIIKQITGTSIPGNILVVTDVGSYIFSESTFAVVPLATPGYSSFDQLGAYISVENLNLGIFNYESTYKLESFTNIYFDPLINGLTSSFLYSATGYLIFSQGVTTSFYLQYPQNSTVQTLTFNGQPQLLTNNTFTGVFQSGVPIEFSLEIFGQNVIGIGTIGLYNGVSTFSPIVGVSSFVAPKTLDWYLQTGGFEDVFGYSDSSIRESNLSLITSNQYQVFLRLTDTIGNITSYPYPSDTIFNQISPQSNNLSLPSGRILDIKYNSVNAVYTPPNNNTFIYSGTQIVRSQGTFISDPLYISGLVSYQEIQVLCQIPGYNEINVGDATNWGTSVTLGVKVADNVSDLNSQEFSNFYSLSTLNSGTDYGNQIVSILANISGLTAGPWLQFELILVTASQNIYPSVLNCLILYSGASSSQFITKTFNCAIQSNTSPTPLIRRGILSANFVTQGGTVEFGYTLNSSDGNFANYTQITPNQIFTLPTPSSQIKFGVLLLSQGSNPAFLDSLGVQLDTGPDNVYFMPAQASFIISVYTGTGSTTIPTNTYQFINKSLGLVNSYLWNFGTSSIGISTILPVGTSLGLAQTSANPIIGFAFTQTLTVGLIVTDFIDSGVVYNSELYTQSFIST